MKRLVDFSYKFQSIKNLDKTFLVTPLTENDMDQCLDVVIKAFFERDIISKLLNLTYKDMHAYGVEVFKRSIKEELAVVCKDASNSRVVAGCLCTDELGMISNPIDFSLCRLDDEKIKQFEEFFAHFPSKNKFKPTKPYEIIYHPFIATHKDYSKYGIATELFKFMTNEHPINKQCYIQYGEATNPYSLKAGLKFGWEILDTVDMIEYKNAAGHNPFKNFSKMAKELGFSDSYKTVSLIAKIRKNAV